MKTKTIILFFVITYAWTWILWLPFVLPYFNLYEMTDTLEGLLMLAVMLGAFGPMIAAVILTYKEGKGHAVKAFFKKCLNFKVHWKYYIIAIILSFGITIIAHYTTTLLNISDLPNTLIPEDIGIPVFVLIIPYTLMIFVLGGGQEELGWRGFIQDPLQDKLGVIKASLLIGVLWGTWHAPLWLIQGEGHSYYSIIAFILYATSWSLVIGIMYNLSGKKVMIPWVMHTLANVSVPFFPVLFLEDKPQPGYWIWTGMNIIVAIIFGYWYYNKQQTKTT